MEYIEGSSPALVVGEFWDDCAYTDSKLEYNQVCLCSFLSCLEEPLREQRIMLIGTCRSAKVHLAQGCNGPCDDKHSRRSCGAEQSR